MPTQVIRHEEDRTGLNPNNLVLNERHTLTPRQRRILVPLHGPYYTESLVITDVDTGKQLKTTDYYHADFVQTAQWLSGKEVASTIVINNRSISNNVSINYQCFGGNYNVNAEVLKAQIEALKLDSRPILYDKILGKPSGFAPAEHMHDVGDVFGWEYLVFSLERIRAAIEMGDENSHLVIYDYINDELEKIRRSMNTSLADAGTHATRRDNPHAVTAEQVGTYTKAKIDELLEAISSRIGADSLTHSSRRDNPHNVTAAQLKVYLKTEVDGLLGTLRTNLETLINNHVNNRNNPHRVTAEQVGTYTKAKIDELIGAVSGRISNDSLTHSTRKDNPHGVTAAQINAFTKEEVNKLVNDLRTALDTKIDGHIARRDNPHGVTAAQINAYTKPEIDRLLVSSGNTSAAFTSHVSNFSNPHKVTAAQVGAYTKAEVNNLVSPKANAADLTKHISNKGNPHGVTAAQINAYTKPQTDNLLNAKANQTALTAHTGNKSNPHGVTAAQVGAYTKAETGTFVDGKVKVANDAVAALRAAVLNGTKIKQAAIPFSTTANNPLTWNKDGLFVNIGPRTLTGDTTNSADSRGHTHAIVKANTERYGVVKLTEDMEGGSKELGVPQITGRWFHHRLKTLEAERFFRTVSFGGPPGSTNGFAENHIWFQIV